MTKTVKVVQTKTNAFKEINSRYSYNIEDKLSDGPFVISNPAFDDEVDAIVIIDDDSKETGAKLPKADKYILRTKFDERVAQGILEKRDMAGMFKTDDAPVLPEIVNDKGEEVKRAFKLAAGKLLAKELGNTPANHLTPFLYAQRIKEELSTKWGTKVSVIGQDELTKLGMNTLLSVGHGSEEDSYVVVIEYKGDPDNDTTLALVGKGVTFDTGGISLKPGAKMHEMKMDMCGSAAVVGAMSNIIAEQPKRNVVAIVGLVENMPSGRAIKPGDVVTSYKGLTVENHNTDAEGRLVLCDLIAYIQDQYPTVNKIIDIATLTGAIVVSLADQYAGFFTNSTELYKHFKENESKDERYWRMPMGKEFAKQLESNVADMKNIGNGHPGSTTAAEFLYKFVNEGVAWAHLDVAGTAMVGGEATGFGVDSLTSFVKSAAGADFEVDEDMKYQVKSS